MEKESDLRNSHYRVPYQQCKEHLQKLNYVCLDKQCHQKSLICSICKDSSSHIRHTIRPLKFYLEQLQMKYQHQQCQMDFNILLEQLQLSQYTFYTKLKKAVQDVAQQFKQLQEQVTGKISKIRNQIHEEMAKKNKFQEFYQSLKRGNIDNSNFLIQNYLPHPSIGKIGNLQNLQTMAQQICLQIKQTKKQLYFRESGQTNNSKDSSLVSLFKVETALKRPPNITFKEELLTQTNLNHGVKSVCLLDYPVAYLSGKMVVKILKIKKGSQLYIGAIPKSVYESMNQIWLPEKLDANCFVLGHDGYTKGWNTNNIARFGQSSSLQICVKNKQFKIIQKTKCSSSKLPQVDIFLFFVLIGQCQIKIVHLK